MIMVEWHELNASMITIAQFDCFSLQLAVVVVIPVRLLSCIQLVDP